MNWKMKKAAVAPVADSPATSRPNWKKNPVSPAIVAAPPKAMANPHAHQASDAIEKFTRIFAIPIPAFLPREKPISRKAKPACMKKTSTVATSTHVVLSSSIALGTASLRLRGSSWAKAAAGAVNRAPSATAPAPARRVGLIGVPPRGSACSREDRRAGPPGHWTRVEDRPGRFRHSVEGGWPGCESAGPTFVRADKVERAGGG